VTIQEAIQEIESLISKFARETNDDMYREILEEMKERADCALIALEEVRAEPG